MRLKIVSHAFLDVPDGTVVQDDGFIKLPNGDFLKPFVTMELNEMTDLTTTQLNQHGCDMDYDGSEITELPEIMS